jgi:hypothetical protein
MALGTLALPEPDCTVQLALAGLVDRAASLYAQTPAMTRGEGMSSDALVMLEALGVAACMTLLGVWLAAWLSEFRRGRPPAYSPAPRSIELPPPVTAGLDRGRMLVLAQELAAHADSAAAQAARAHAAMQAALTVLNHAETLRAGAEAEYDAARLAYADALSTARAGRHDEPDEQTQARERDVSRAALDAYRRGELSVEVLRTVFGRAEPDPAQDGREREADRLAIAEAQARRAFEHAVVAARMAREDLHVAEVADEASQQEAANAAHEAHEAQIGLQAATPARRGGTSRKRGSGTTHPTRRGAAR